MKTIVYEEQKEDKLSVLNVIRLVQIYVAQN